MATREEIINRLIASPTIERAEFLKLCSPLEIKSMSHKYKCPICNAEIPDERIEILRELRYTESDFYCTKHALNKTVKAVYSGEHGTSELIMCDRVYNDSVRSKFYDSEEVEEPDDTVEDESDSSEI